MTLRRHIPVSTNSRAPVIHLTTSTLQDLRRRISTGRHRTRAPQLTRKRHARTAALLARFTRSRPSVDRRCLLQLGGRGSAECSGYSRDTRPTELTFCCRVSSSAAVVRVASCVVSWRSSSLVCCCLFIIRAVQMRYGSQTFQSDFLGWLNHFPFLLCSAVL